MTAGTLPARRRRRLAPFPWSARRSAVISWMVAIFCYLRLHDAASRRLEMTSPRPGKSIGTSDFCSSSRNYSRHPWRSRYAPSSAFAFAILQTQSRSDIRDPVSLFRGTAQKSLGYSRHPACTVRLFAGMTTKEFSVSSSIHVQTADRFPIRHAADGFGQQLRNGQLADLLARGTLLAQRDGVGDHQFVHLRFFDVADRRPRQHRMGAVRDHFL